MGVSASVAEIIAFFLAGKILEALGVNFCSILILLAFAVRFAGYYLIPIPIYLTLIESMHFFNFGIFYVLVGKEADALGQSFAFMFRLSQDFLLQHHPVCQALFKVLRTVFPLVWVR